MSGDLQFNKIAGAGLATVFVILLVNEGTAMLYSSEPPEKMGYFIDAPEEPTGGAEGPVLPPDWGTLLPVADLAAGERAFSRCASCHTINQGGANGIGPNLWGVVGANVANHAGFEYSAALTEHAASAPTWTYDELDLFITAPARHVPGTRMSFAGLRNTEERVALIAYLRQQGSTGYAIPAPDPARQPVSDTATATEGMIDGGEQAPVEGPAAAPLTDETTPGQEPVT